MSGGAHRADGETGPLSPWILVVDGVIRFARLDRIWPGVDFTRVVSKHDLAALDLEHAAACTVRVGTMTSQHEPAEWKRRAAECFR